MAASKRVGVVLSGCGYLDGTEIQEATLTLLALDKLGATVVPIAPAADQADVVNHQEGKPGTDRRDVRAESARICRGNVREISGVKASELDALVFPGGYGAAKNLSTFAKDGAHMRANPEVERLIREMRAANKPQGFICIAPVLAARVLGAEHPQLTIGSDRDTAAALEAMGARHQACRVDEVCVDQKLKVVSTPAYMLGPSIAKVAAGIDKLVAAVVELA